MERVLHAPVSQVLAEGICTRGGWRRCSEHRDRQPDSNCDIFNETVGAALN